MHQFLRAVGFSNIESKNQLKELLNDVIFDSTRKDFIDNGKDDVLVEYSKNYSPSCGITLRGEYDEKDNLTLDFYYPVVNPENVSSTEEVTFERRIDKESFAGVIDDIRVGVSLIYYVQNGIYLKKKFMDDNFGKAKLSTSLCALSLGGTVLLPIRKNPKEQEQLRKYSVERNKKIMAAKKGDEEAIEQLTLEEIDTFSAVSKRLLKDDVFTLVDSYFMPFGVECDQYSILAQIEDVKLETNYLSKELVYVMDLNCNNLPITLCINKKDLLGDPVVGRRFRGNIWLQGRVEAE